MLRRTIITIGMCFLLAGIVYAGFGSSRARRSGDVSETEFLYLIGTSSNIQDQLDASESGLTDSASLAATLTDETGTGLSVFNTAPVFVTSIEIGSAVLNEAELEILDGCNITTTRLNYLAAIVGSTGTNTTNMVFSESPVLTGSPSLANPTAVSLTLDAAATPAWVFRDSGNPGTDKEIAKIYANFLSGGDGAEDGSIFIQAMLGGTEITVIEWDSDTEVLTLGDSATGEDLTLDFDSGTANEVKISSNSGVTEIDLSAISVITTGNIQGGIAITSTTAATLALTSANTLGDMHINGDADVIDYTLPAAVEGLSACFYAGGNANVITIDSFDGVDTIYLNGASVGAGDAIDSAGGAGDFICLIAVDATNWHTLGRSGTWVDGGVD